MATPRKDTHPVPTGTTPGAPAPAAGSPGENSASELIEAPQKPGKGKLDPHDFAIGGGSGGGEAFSRKKTK
jgi:hypothetical protein